MPCFKLLLADDDEDDFFIIRQAFEEFGRPYDLVHIKDGKQLLEHLSVISKSGQQLPDLVLLDVNMPEMDGVQALEHIRSDVSYSGMPVFMYSTSASDDERQTCIRLGANGFFTKAYSYRKILAFVSDIDAYLNGGLLTRLSIHA